MDGGGGASDVSGDAVADGGMVAVDDAADFGKAVAAFGVVADHPPELVAGGGDGSGAVVAAELVSGDASASTDGVRKGEKTADGERGDDSVGVEVDGWGHRMSFGWAEDWAFPLPLPVFD